MNLNLLLLLRARMQAIFNLWVSMLLSGMPDRSRKNLPMSTSNYWKDGLMYWCWLKRGTILLKMFLFDVLFRLATRLWIDLDLSVKMALDVEVELRSSSALRCVHQSSSWMSFQLPSKPCAYHSLRLVVLLPFSRFTVLLQSRTKQKIL